MESVGEQRRRAPPLTRFEQWLVPVLNLPVVAFGRAFDVLTLLLARPTFLPTYLRLWRRELFFSPYRYPKAFDVLMRVKAAGQRLEELVYGELPVFSALYLFKRAGFTRGSRLLDLGAGRGRPLIAARLLGGSARGVELLPSHVTVSRDLLSTLDIVMEQGDSQNVPLGLPSHVFLNWCGLEPETRIRIERHVATLPPGTVFLSVAGPLDVRRFDVVSKHRVLFTWGTAIVFIQRRRAG